MYKYFTNVKSCPASRELIGKTPTKWRANIKIELSFEEKINLINEEKMQTGLRGFVRETVEQALN